MCHHRKTGNNRKAEGTALGGLTCTCVKFSCEDSEPHVVTREGCWKGNFDAACLGLVSCKRLHQSVLNSPLCVVFQLTALQAEAKNIAPVVRAGEEYS